MPAGSCVLFVGTFWHGGGANRSAAPRLAATAQYCQPWLRTQEAFTLSTSIDVVREVSEDIRRMLGYSIHPPFVGMVNGMHPNAFWTSANPALSDRPASANPASNRGHRSGPKRPLMGGISSRVEMILVGR
ncbi:phytanoyl-CoA dioxygenase family protein [Spirillospora sp. CA-128828]|uniref:phytanoyl-CoA dioxygenase family protein n=1 Tax=Spirillospora sp. CA-128828 TaxID=3240033 RepID=UPI003D92FA44